jgi:hypothetical protein
MDGSEFGGDIIPKAVATYISETCNNQSSTNQNPNNIFPCLLAQNESSNSQNPNEENHMQSSSSSVSTGASFFQSQQVYIDFEKPIHIYQMILGMRKLGFRLFLFDSPPNSEALCIEQRLMNC